MEGVGVAEFGVRDDREPLLRDAFEPDQRLSWYAHKELFKDVFVVTYSF